MPEGPATILNALRAAAPDATIVVPCHTAVNSLTSLAFRAATAGMDAAQLARYMDSMPGFDPLATPSAGMGALAEYVRTSASAVRSAHPVTSFAAVGPRADECVRTHPPDCLLGENSPVGWLYRSGAAILLLGVGYGACTALHLAEYRLPGRVSRRYECFVRNNGSRQMRIFTDIHLDDGDFADAGTALDSQPFVRRTTIGTATCRLIEMRAAVDFVLDWPPFRSRRGVVVA